ncbi:hypothetical protein C3L50_08380 [Flavobacterium alvei]|uniref:Secretion system C-terminal sorting domain-containing protein n=1 Tax=Flavobacterium alvei TaxID=2080416 RepID=A0A2S5AB87_9FLAO|nr:T9SS type A sorting domain-containing protein [Flavobacterium alvei]POY39838.1 hypothetical protein C3L50_08380 [Flavobacterium alvei]
MTKKLLKNRLFVATALMLVVALAPMQSIAQKKIAYVTKTKTMDATAATVTTDPIIKMFEADSRFTITVIQDDGNGSSAVNLSQYDLLVIQESFGGGDNVLKPAGIYAIKNLTIPVIYNKAYALKSTRALTASAAVPADVADLAITVPAAKQSNPLFTGVTFTNDAVAIFNAQYTDAGAPTGTLKSLQKDSGIELSATGTNLALVTGVTATDAAIVLNDIPGGTSFGTGGSDILPLTSRMIAFSWNFGAICGGNGTNMTANALKIWKNAALILTGQSLGLKENALASDSISVYPNPTNGLVTVNSTAAVKAITVYDTTGKQISASKTNTVDLSNQAKGVYLVQVQTENGSTSKKVVVE